MSVLDPKSARARLLRFVVMAAQSRSLLSTERLAAHLDTVAPPVPSPRLRSTGAHRIRASYALAWLRRSGMVRRGEEALVSGGWEPTEYGRAVLRAMKAETENHGGGN